MVTESNPVADFLSAFRAANADTTHEEWKALDATCTTLVHQRVRNLIENYGASRDVAWSDFEATGEGRTLVGAGERIQHAIFNCERREEHARFLSEFN